MAKRHSVAQLYSPDLLEVLAQYPAGKWVAISQDGKRIVGSGPSAGRAERQAQASGHQPGLVLQVPAGGYAAKPAKNGNGNGKHDGQMPLNLPSFYRGIYKRVAKKLGCDPSYVSRVARGERASDAVSHALETELSHAMVLTNKGGSKLRRSQA